MMNTGRISYNMAQRSVRKAIKSGSRLLPGFAQYKDCAVIPGESGRETVTSVFSGTISAAGMERLLFFRGCNELWCEHVCPCAVSAAFVLPQTAQEPWLAEQMKALVKLCEETNIVFGQGFVTVSSQVLAPVLTLTFTGETAAAASGGKMPQAGDMLVAVGHAGMAGAGLIAREKRDELCRHYAGGFLDRAAAFWEDISLAWTIDSLNDVYLFPVQEGGIFAALWYLADGLSLGFETELKSIPIRQETVEICEFYRRNPYLLAGDGMVLAVTADPKKLLYECGQAGKEAIVLGRLTKEKGRILRNEEEVRYLDKPAQDELEQIEWN